MFTTRSRVIAPNFRQESGVSESKVEEIINFKIEEAVTSIESRLIKIETILKDLKTEIATIKKSQIPKVDSIENLRLEMSSSSEDEMSDL